MHSRLLSLIFLLICALLTLGIFYWQHQHAQQKHRHKQTSAQPIRALMTDIQAVRFNQAGKRYQELSAARAIHYTQNDRLDITAPKVTVYTEKNRWHLKAKLAKTTTKLDRIDLSGKVSVINKSNHLAPSARMLTSKLALFPKTQLATTKQPVVIKQTNSQLNAVGMHLSLKDGTIALLSDTQANFVSKG